MVTDAMWMPTVLEAIGPTIYPGRGHMISTAVTETTGAIETTMTGVRSSEAPGAGWLAVGGKNGGLHTYICMSLN